MSRPYLKHGDELLFRDAHSLFITTIYNVNDGIGICIVASPVRSDARLTAKILRNREGKQMSWFEEKLIDNHNLRLTQTVRSQEIRSNERKKL